MDGPNALLIKSLYRMIERLGDTAAEGQDAADVRVLTDVIDVLTHVDEEAVRQDMNARAERQMGDPNP